MADLSETEDLEPLFDYHRVQHNVISVDDDDKSPVSTPKRRKTNMGLVQSKDEQKIKEVDVVHCDDNEEDWLPPLPDDLRGSQNQLGEDSFIREMRLKKQELLSVANSQIGGPLDNQVDNSTLKASLEAVTEQPSVPPIQRAKIVISVQDKDGLKQFRVYMDEKFERIFKMYADKVKLDVQSLTFCFDGDKIDASASPTSLGMEDEDIIEVHGRKN